MSCHSHKSQPPVVYTGSEIGKGTSFTKYINFVYYTTSLLFIISFWFNKSWSWSSNCKVHLLWKIYFYCYKSVKKPCWWCMHDMICSNWITYYIRPSLVLSVQSWCERSMIWHFNNFWQIVDLEYLNAQVARVRCYSIPSVAKLHYNCSHRAVPWTDPCERRLPRMISLLTLQFSFQASVIHPVHMRRKHCHQHLTDRQPSWENSTRAIEGCR